MKLLIIPEDQTLDGFIIKPVVEAICSELSMTARVDVLPEPRLRGADDALDRELIAEIVDQNPMTDLFLLVVDQDCNRARNVERAEDREQEHAGKLMACVAIQEIEVWLLALHRDRIEARWTEIRADCDPKERWAEPLLETLGAGGPGRGRKKAMEALPGQLRSLLGVCAELGVLRDRLDQWRSRTPRGFPLG